MKCEAIKRDIQVVLTLNKHESKVLKVVCGSLTGKNDSMIRMVCDEIYDILGTHGIEYDADIDAHIDGTLEVS